MHFGIAMFLTDECPAPGVVGSLVEERGFRSLYLCEHTNIPVGSEVAYPREGPLPRRYYRCIDPFVALAAAATTTTTLQLGTGVCLLAQRDPVITAKEAASVDLVSNGRFEFGIGAGWNPEEAAQHGVPFARRFGVLREKVEVVKGLWTEDVFSYEGEHVSLAPTRMWPKPVQRPHPPVIVGGIGEGVAKRVLRYGDGWMPNSDARLKERIASIRSDADREGRPLSVTFWGGPEDATSLAHLQDAGVDGVLFAVPTEHSPEFEAGPDTRRALIDEFRGTS